MQKSDPLINKEHGSWAILFIPPLTGILSTGKFTFDTLLYLLLSLAAFLIARPAEIYFQDVLKKNPASSKRENAFRWMTIYSAITIIMLVLLLLKTNAYMILFFGGAAALFIIVSQILQYKSGKTLMRDLSGIAGLTVGAPAVYYLHTGNIDPESMLLWVYNFLFFASGAFYVHATIEAQGNKSGIKNGLKSRKNLSLIYHIILSAGLIIFILYDAPVSLALAYLPMVIQALWGIVSEKKKANFKKIGFTLLAYSVFFGIVIGMMK